MNILAILLGMSTLQALDAPKVQDWLFMDAQERFVIETVKPKDRRKLVPEPIAKCFDRLGSKYYKVRERASDDLRKMDRELVSRWLFWGQTWNDPEVMLRCGTLIHEASRCIDCGGKGYGGEPGLWSVSCRPCLGRGYYWILGLLCDNGID